MNNYFDLKSNDMISSMKYDDIIEFLHKLSEYKLSLRNSIGLDKSNTFGLEIEFENIVVLYEELCAKFNELSLYPSIFLNKNNVKKLGEYQKQNKRRGFFVTESSCLPIKPEEVFYWSVDKDNSLNNGAEITSPILIDDKNHWNDLKTVCNFIKEYGEISEHSAGHIHIGAQALGKKKESWMNFIKLWSVYENVIYRFGFNEYLFKNPGIRYCKPISEWVSKIYKSLSQDYDLETILHFLKEDRTHAINFQNVVLTDKTIPFGTIEIRNPNGTLDPVIWQNNVNFFSKLLMYCNSSNFDMDTVLRRERNLFDFQKYYQIFTEQAIELADMIFDNNLDKVNFLRQYIKDGKVSQIPMTKTKKFTI